MGFGWGTPEEIIARYEKVFSRVQRVSYAPVIAVRGRNSRVFDVSGRAYIDFTSSAAVMNLGYCDPEIVKVIKEQAEELIHFTFIYGYNIPALQLAEELLSLTGFDDWRVVLGLSGSDANEGALMLAKGFRRNSKILISNAGSFHGCCVGTTTVSGVDLSVRVSKIIGSWLESVKVPYPYCYRCPLGLKPESCGMSCVEYVRTLVDNVGSENVVALITEPIQGDGGIVVPPENYFTRLEDVLRKHEIPIILDEVQTGLGRTGKWFGYQHFNFRPDVITLGKPLGSGLPISAILGREDIMNSLPDFAYSFTLAGNPLIARVALRTIQLIREKDLVRRAEKLGEIVLRRLSKLRDECSIVGDVRGKGLMIGLELVKDKESKVRGFEEAKKVVWRAYELGLFIMFLSGNVLRIQPPLTIEEEVLEEGLNILEKSIKDVEEGKVGNEVLTKIQGW
ncbi:MAG: aminotransferase class III-fold pyridoxal phosphate-dependent enzyme [Desulfurococcaceae archaeon TW002]